MNKTHQELFAVAKTAMDHAHSPYSGYKVGAAIRMSDGKIYGGCNVENASYGGTICAERSAIVSAIAQGSSKVLAEVLVITDSTSPWPPCGLCRQVIAEFASPTCLVHLANLSGVQQSVEFSKLFPSSFNPTHLK